MTTHRQLCEAWADNAIVAIEGLDDQGLTDWIVTTKDKQAECARHAPASLERVRATIRERDAELRAARIRQGVG